MRINNIRLLTKDEIRSLSSAYDIDVKDAGVIVKTKKFPSGYVHSVDGFKINVTNNSVKINYHFSKEAIAMWAKTFKPNYDLFSVQNAINVLQVLHQSITEKNVKSILARESVSIQII